MSTTDISSTAKGQEVVLNRVTSELYRVVIDNPPVNVMGAEFVLQLREIVSELETDLRVKVVISPSPVTGQLLG
jgi:enoyl-CoA hydratase/carnithine racemase